MQNKDFVTFLVDETLKLQQSGESELSSLELKLNDYELKFFRGEFIPQSQTLRFITSFGKIDVPVNWSIFSLDAISGGHAVLDAKNDQDSFFTVMKSVWPAPLEKLLVTHADGFCYLVGLNAGDELHLHDLLNPQEWLKSA